MLTNQKVKKLLSSLILGFLSVLFLLVLFQSAKWLLDLGLVSASKDSTNEDVVSMGSVEQSLGAADSRDVALGDLDGDGDLDAVIANSGGPNRVWWNDGAGVFSDSGQSIGTSDSYGLDLGKIDGDDHLDVFFANYNQPNSVWLNDGGGIFSDTNQLLGSAPSNAVALGLLDDNDYLDAFVANGSSISNSNEVWLNDGSGVFSSSLQLLGSSWSEAVVLGNLDGDDDLDAFVANGSNLTPPDRVWINEGGGVYSDSHQVPSFIWSTGAALGKLNTDEHLDAFTSSWSPQANRVFINQGDGTFADSGLSLGNAGSTDVALGDLDGDSDIDAMIGNFAVASAIWLNNGSGDFSPAVSGLVSDGTWAVALGDLDDDGDLDAFLANSGPNKIWRNEQINIPRAIFNVERDTNQTGQDVYYSSSPAVELPIMLEFSADEALDIHINVNSPESSITKTIAITIGQQLVLLDVQGGEPQPIEEHVLTIYVTKTSIPPEPTDITDKLSLYFVDAAEGPEDCFLCFNTWLAWQSGFVPIFDTLHHLELNEERQSAQWRYYTALIKIHTPEMIDIIASNPLVLWKALTTFNSWTPAAKALDDGKGDQTTVNQWMADNAHEFLNEMKDEASPSLAATIKYETEQVDLDSFVDLDINEAWSKFSDLRQQDELFISIILSDNNGP